MKTIKKLDWKNLKHEYGVDGQRLLPWHVNDNIDFPFPFGGAYCITRSKTKSLEHINEPSDEEEMFIVVSGKGLVHVDGEITEVAQGDVVYISSGQSHFVENPYDEDFHFYALWWNNGIITGYTKN